MPGEESAATDSWNGEEDSEIQEGRDGLPLNVAVIEVKVAPTGIAKQGATGS